MKDLKLNLSLEDIKVMKKSKLNNMIKISIRSCALEYLLGKRSKGKDIEYSEIKMAEYLMPNDSNLTISQKRDIFEVRNRMLPIPQNFPAEDKCDKCVKCEQTEDMLHIYYSECWNNEVLNIPYENIYSENISHIKKVFLQIKVNFERRNKFITEKDTNIDVENEKHEEPPHEILFCDPPTSVLKSGNGNK